MVHLFTNAKDQNYPFSPAFTYFKLLSLSKYEYISWAVKAFNVLSGLPQRRLSVRWLESWEKTGSRASIWQPPSSTFSSASQGAKVAHLHGLAKTHSLVWWVLYIERRHNKGGVPFGGHIFFLENHNIKYSYHNMTSAAVKSHMRMNECR